jgi:hypothetical protein
MKELTLSNGAGGRVPNFAAFGLKFKEAQKYAEKLDELWRRQREAGREAEALVPAIRDLEEEMRKARALAILGGEEPDETPLQEARARAETLQREIQDLRRAVEYGQDALMHAVHADGDEHRAKLAEQVDREAEEVAALERGLAAKRHALESKMALDRWLENPEGGFGVAPGAGGSRMSEYGWDFRALLGLDDEERRAAMGEHVLSMIDAAEERRGKDQRGLLDYIHRARLTDEAEGKE